MDGWNTIVSSWDGLFSGAMLVSRRVVESLISLSPCNTSNPNESQWVLQNVSPVQFKIARNPRIVIRGHSKKNTFFWGGWIKQAAKCVVNFGLLFWVGVIILHDPCSYSTWYRYHLSMGLSNGAPPRIPTYFHRPWACGPPRCLDCFKRRLGCSPGLTYGWPSKNRDFYLPRNHQFL